MEAAPLIVDVERLARDGEQLTGEIPAAVVDLDPADPLLAPAGNIRYDLFVQLIGEELLVRGTVSQLFHCTCVRCGGAFERESVDPGVTLAVQPQGAPFVDLTPDLRECIILTLPNHPLCRAECLGLCSQCGADLNRGPCGCPERRDDRWGALEALGGE